MRDPFDNNGHGHGEADPPSTALSLLQLLWADDPEGWDRMINLYAPLIYRWCRQKGLPAADAADVAQDALVAACVSIGKFDDTRDDSSFRGWLRRMTEYKIADHYRRQRNAPRTNHGATLDHVVSSSPAACDGETVGDSASDTLQIASGELCVLLERVRPAFEPTTWRMFWQATVVGRRPVDVAAELDVTPNAVSIAKSRVLKRLRAEMRLKE